MKESFANTTQKWIDRALISEQMNQDGYDSIHIDELLNMENSDVSNQITTAKQVFETLITLTQSISEDYKPTLIISIEDTETLTYIERDTLYSGEARLAAPPEIYLIRREKELEPYVVEEYKKPLASDIKAENGFVYCYFSSQRRSDTAEYSPAIFYEYYPKAPVAYSV